MSMNSVVSVAVTALAGASRAFNGDWVLGRGGNAPASANTSRTTLDTCAAPHNVPAVLREVR